MMTRFKAIAIKSHTYRTPEQLKERDKLIRQNKEIMRYNEEKAAKEKLEKDNEEKTAKEKLASEKGVKQQLEKNIRKNAYKKKVKSKEEGKENNQKPKEVGSDDDFEIEEESKDKPVKEKKQKSPVKRQKLAKGMKNASTNATLKSNEEEGKKRNQKRKEVGNDDDFEIEENVKEKPPKAKKQKLTKSKKEARKQKPKDVGGEEDDFMMEEDREFKTQCRPQGLYELINTFNEKQKADIKSIGFGGLLQMSIKQLPTSLMKQLVAKFHSNSRMLQIDEHHAFAITPVDIYDVLLLPRNSGKDDVEMKHGDRLVDVPIIKDWMEKYNFQWNSPYKDVKEVLVGMKNGGDDFKRLFVVFSLSSFLAPNANRTANFNAVHSLVDVDKIRDLDWCSYVLKRLCWAAMKYNDEGNSRTQSFSGYGLLLQILYFHRLKWQGFAEPFTLPLIQHWTTERIRKRVKEEIKSGTLGMGEWVVDVYLICLKAGFKQIDDNDQLEVVSSEKVEETNDSSIFTFTCAMPSGELSDSAIREIATDEVHASILTMRRDLFVMMTFHMKKITQIKENFADKPSSGVDKSESPKLSDNDNFFDNEELHAYVDKVEQNYKKMKEVADAMPSFELVPDFDDEECGEASDAINLSGCKGNREDDWIPDEDVGYISCFLKDNKKLLADMDRELKEIVDYCMFKDESVDDE